MSSRGASAEQGLVVTEPDPDRILFVTGRLAEPALRKVVDQLSQQLGCEAQIEVLPITVAALMHVDWVAQKLSVAEPFDRAVLPGWCQGELDRLRQQFGFPFERGPKDLFDLPEHFGKQAKAPVNLDAYSIDILAEINHAPRLADAEIMRLAQHFRASGADLIDLGCIPGETWSRVGDVTRLLVADGFLVSIDSFNQREVEESVAAGATLVLSCNSSNVEWASRLDVEFVAIPDAPFTLDSLQPTIDCLRAAGRTFRIDPIIEPIGFGFAASLARYIDARRRWPDLEMMMGIGNLTELTEVDSAGVNFILAALCEELRCHSVLTTEVINWARSAVREFDLARRLVHYSVQKKALPKHVDSSLVMLRDPKVHELGEQALAQLAGQIKDPNYRIFAERGEIHVMNRDGYWHGTDPYALFDQFRTAAPKPLDAAHAFYLGNELNKAATALTLGKQYMQDEALRWGFLTTEEVSALERRRHESIG